MQFRYHAFYLYASILYRAAHRSPLSCSHAVPCPRLHQLMHRLSVPPLTHPLGVPKCLGHFALQHFLTAICQLALHITKCSHQPDETTPDVPLQQQLPLLLATLYTFQLLAGARKSLVHLFGAFGMASTCKPCFPNPHAAACYYHLYSFPSSSSCVGISMHPTCIIVRCLTVCSCADWLAY